ncbi:5760_t:CDS:2, partial [Cetraspora pellucida]
MGYGGIWGSLRAKETQVRDWFIQTHKNVFKFDENKSVVTASNEAIKSITNIKVHLKHHHESQKRACEHELDVLCNKNRILDGKIKVGLPWLSIFLGISRDTVKQKYKNLKVSSEYVNLIWKEAEITFSESCVKPTDKLLEDVNDALNKNTTKEKMQALLNITEKYGSFYACRLILGKASFNEKKHISSSNGNFDAKHTELQFGLELNSKVNADLKLDNNTKNKSRSFDTYSYSRNKDIGDREDYTKWDIIGYDDIHLIFDLLNDDLRKRVLDVLGHRILSAGTVSLPVDFNNTKPLVCSLETARTKIENINECHIFVSITNENDGNVNKVFSSHVEYADEYTPEIVVYRIRRKKNRFIRAIQHKKDIKKSYSLKLNWIIVGQPKYFDFDMLDYPVILRSYNYNGFKMENNFIQIPIDKVQDFKKDILKLRETCILSTCVLKTSALNNDLYDRKKASITFGTHYSSSNQAVCMFAYDLNENKNLIDERILRELSLHICAVEVDPSYRTFKFGQAQIKSRIGDKSRDIYYGFEEPKLKNIFAGNENLILVNQILECPENCKDHGTVNVNIDKIIYKQFGSQRIEERAIAYLI